MIVHTVITYVKNDSGHIIVNFLTKYVIYLLSVLIIKFSSYYSMPIAAWPHNTWLSVPLCGAVFLQILTVLSIIPVWVPIT